MPARVDLPLIRRRNRKPVGTLAIVRANHPAFTDKHGARRSNPVRCQGRDGHLMCLEGSIAIVICLIIEA
jgi:hypothetical protein